MLFLGQNGKSLADGQFRSVGEAVKEARRMNTCRNGDFVYWVVDYNGEYHTV